MKAAFPCAGSRNQARREIFSAANNRSRRRTHAALLIKEQQRRGELDFEQCTQRLLSELAPVDPRHFAVAAQIECDAHKVLLRTGDYVLLAEVDPHQRRAVGTAVLAEIDQQPLGSGVLRRGYPRAGQGMTR